MAYGLNFVVHSVLKAVVERETANRASASSAFAEASAGLRGGLGVSLNNSSLLNIQTYMTAYIILRCIILIAILGISWEHDIGNCPGPYGKFSSLYIKLSQARSRSWDQCLAQLHQNRLWKKTLTPNSKQVPGTSGMATKRSKRRGCCNNVMVSLEPRWRSLPL